MGEGTSHGRDDEPLLARISEAAGHRRLGRRHATYPAAPHTATAPTARGAAIRRFWRAVTATATGRPRWAGNRRGTSARTRLDFYEDGMTVAVNGRIHAVRYDTTSVHQHSARSPQDTTRAHVRASVQA